jgi:hypothetical protein
VRRLTGVARGGALDIARHSLERGTSCAAAGAISWHSNARIAEKHRNIDKAHLEIMPGMILYRRIPRPSWRQFQDARE